MRLRLVAPLGVLALVGALGLAGCSDVQSNKAACSIITIAVQDVGTRVSSATTDMQSDSVTGAKELLAAQKAFHARVITVKNPQVRSKADQADADLKKYITAVLNEKDSPTSDNKTKVQTLLTALTADIDGIGTVCKG